jgi:hypothetical protein
MSNTKQSVWLVIDVPAYYSNQIESLKQELKEFAQERIREVQGNTQVFGDEFSITFGVADTRELCVFERKRG